MRSGWRSTAAEGMSEGPVGCVLAPAGPPTHYPPSEKHAQSAPPFNRSALGLWACFAAYILGGGPGADLWPLTAYRAEPAVPFGGLFRLIDVPISK